MVKIITAIISQGWSLFTNWVNVMCFTAWLIANLHLQSVFRKDPISCTYFCCRNTCEPCVSRTLVYVNYSQKWRMTTFSGKQRPLMFPIKQIW